MKQVAAIKWLFIMYAVIIIGGWNTRNDFWCIALHVRRSIIKLNWWMKQIETKLANTMENRREKTEWAIEYVNKSNWNANISKLADGLRECDIG